MVGINTKFRRQACFIDGYFNAEAILCQQPAAVWSLAYLGLMAVIFVFTMFHGVMVICSKQVPRRHGREQDANDDNVD